MLIFSSSPILTVILILLESFVLCLIIFYSLRLSLLSYILFLIFLGGLIVLFVYICTLASNEKQTNSNKTAIIALATFSFTLWSLQCQEVWFKTRTLTESLVKVIRGNRSFLYVYLFIYLLLTLLVCVLVRKKKEGAIRSKLNYENTKNSFFT